MNSPVQGSPTQPTSSDYTGLTNKTEATTSTSPSGLPTTQANASVISSTLTEASNAAAILSNENNEGTADEVSSDDEAPPEDETAIQADDHRKGDSDSSDEKGSSGDQNDQESTISEHEKGGSTTTSSNPLDTVTPLSAGPANISGSSDLEAVLNKQMADNLSNANPDISTNSTLGKMEDISIFSQSIANEISGSKDSLVFTQNNVSSLLTDMKSNPLNLSSSTVSQALGHFNKANDMLTNANLSSSDVVMTKLTSAAQGQIGLGFKSIFTEMLANPGQLQAALAQGLSPSAANVLTQVITTINPEVFSKLSVPDSLIKPSSLNGNPPPNSNKNGVSIETTSPSLNQMASILAAFGADVTTDEVLEAQFSSLQSQQSSAISTLNAEQSQMEAAQQLASIQKQQNEEAQAKKTANIIKWVTMAVMIVAVIALSVVTLGAATAPAATLMSVAMPLLMTAVMVASLGATASGHSSVVVGQLALGLREIPGSHLSNEASEMIASAIIAVIMMVATGGAAAFELFGEMSTTAIALSVVAAGSTTLSTTGGFTDMGQLLAQASGGSNSASIAWIVGLNVLGMVLSMGSSIIAAKSMAATAAATAKAGSTTASAAGSATASTAEQTSQVVNQTAKVAEDTEEGIEMMDLTNAAKTTSTIVSTSQSDVAAVKTGSQSASDISRAADLGANASVTSSEANTALPGGITAISEDDTVLSENASDAENAEELITGNSILRTANTSLQQMNPSKLEFMANLTKELSDTEALSEAATGAKNSTTMMEKLKAATPMLTKIFAGVELGGDIVQGVLNIQMGEILSNLATTEYSLGVITAALDEIKNISERTLQLSNQVTQSYNNNSTGLQTALNNMTQQQALGASTSAQGLQQNIG